MWIVHQAEIDDWDCKCIWLPKWVLMIMTRTFKEPMRLLSYEQDLKSLQLKRASIDAKFAKGTVHELHWGVSLIFIFEFEYRKHRTIKRDAKLRFGDAIVSRLEANKQSLDTLHHLTINLKNTVGFGSSDPRSELPTPPSEVSSFVRQKVLGLRKIAGSEVLT